MNATLCPPPAGGLLSLLFEDLFKRLNSDIKRQADAVLSKANRATQVGGRGREDVCAWALCAGRACART